MLGLHSCTDAPPQELPEFRRLAELLGDAKPIVRGPLVAAATPGSAVACAREGDTTCVLEGQLYDRPALARGLVLDADDDAHLVARAHRRLGLEALPRLRGRYAAVLWDDVRQEGLIASDLLAAREMFVCRTAGALVFATELHDVLALLSSRPAPDEIGFTTWLGDGTCPSDRTLYAGISRLAPGELMALSRRTAQRRRYWSPEPRAALTGSRAELSAGWRALLETSVAKRLSPRRSAVILSGGFDSSVVSAVAAGVAPPGAQVRTYSGVFPGADYDESAKIRQVNERIGIDPGAMEIAPQGTLWLALRYTRHWQLPLIAAGSLIDIAATQTAASDGAEVVLDGQTGDELFGLSPYLFADRIRHGRLLSALGLTNQWPIGRRMSPRSKVWMIKELGVKGGAPHALGRFVQGRRDRAAVGPPWLTPRLRDAFAHREDRWAWKLAGPGPMWWRWLSDALIDGPHRELRLQYLRHRAASNGLVAEPPLYDVDLIEYALRLPPEFAYDRRYDRPLVREAMSGLLPDEVRFQTQKADFTRFCEHAMVNADGAGITRLLTAPDALIGAYTDRDWVRSCWNRTIAGHGRPEWLGALWRLTAAEVWLRSHADPDFLDAAMAQPDVPAPSVRRVALVSDR
ncbi:MAG TPA: asparagine synthase-related protein [Solirubrobacteraceae bacterium]|jgi:asparagine synthase (glutamine-hydrolysing)